jgi:hypothetical protein
MDVGARITGRVVSAGLGLFLLCAGSAAFAGAVSNVPTGDWIIGPINAASSSGVGYCSMKNDYRDGNTIVFARDAEGSNSLAIDFHKKALETGGQYNVTLQLGPLQRQMTAIAATPSVMIIQMGLDRDFLVSLQRRPNLTVDFQTSRMTFGLDGAKNGFQALTSCAQAIGARHRFSQVKVPVKNADAKTLAATEPAAGDTPVMPAAVFPQGQPTQQALIIQPVDPSKPVSAGAAFTGNLGEDAVQATLQDQIESLKQENRKLLLENQRVAEQMQSNDGPPVAAAPVEPVQSEAVSANTAPMLPVPPPTQFTGESGASPNNVTAALTAAQAGIQQALEAQQQQEELARKQADLAAENARLKASLQAAQAETEQARKQAAIEAENMKLKAELAAEQKAKQEAEQAAAEAQRQAQVATENAKLKAELAAAEQERQRALEAEHAQEQSLAAGHRASEAQAQAVAAELHRQSEINARHAQMVAEANRSLKVEAPAEAAAEPAPAPVPQAAAPQPRVSLQIVSPPDDFIKRLLARTRVLGVSDSRAGAYTWNLGGIDGSAEQRDLNGSLPDAVDAYVHEQSQRCHGDFAHNVRPGKDAAGAQVMEGELACMNGVSDAAAAVLFIARNGKLTVISHQGPPSRMEKALSDRDTMVAAMGQ